MKIVLLSIFLFTGVCTVTNAQTITFTYDASGNRTGRSYVVSSTKSAQVTQQQENLTKELPKEQIVNYRVYPNPVSEILQVEFLGSTGESTITLYHINGQRICWKETDKDKVTIAMKSLPAGIYMLNLRQGQTIREWKIIKN